MRIFARMLRTIATMFALLLLLPVSAQQQQYRPDGRAFVCVNGKNRFTRALYGSPTEWRVETSDRPVFAVYKKKDCRKNLSKQQFIQKSAISLCLVSDISKMIRFDDSFRRELYSPMDVGYVSENIYLYCAANNLATCACGLINRDKIAKILGLGNARVMLVHPIGKGI